MGLDATFDGFLADLGRTQKGVGGLVDRISDTLADFTRAVENLDKGAAGVAAAKDAALAEAGIIIEAANRSAFEVVTSAHKDAASIIAAAKSTAEAEATRYQGDRSARLREIYELDGVIVARRQAIEQLDAELASLRARFGG